MNGPLLKKEMVRIFLKIYDFKQFLNKRLPFGTECVAICEATARINVREYIVFLSFNSGASKVSCPGYLVGDFMTQKPFSFSIS